VIEAYGSLGRERRAVRRQLPIKRGRLSGDGAGCPCGGRDWAAGAVAVWALGFVWGSGLAAGFGCAIGGRRGRFALQQRADGVEDAGAEEAEDDVTEVKADPGGDEQNPSRARNCLRFIS
jgi:hypothetical protein